MLANCELTLMLIFMVIRGETEMLLSLLFAGEPVLSFSKDFSKYLSCYISIYFLCLQ